MKKKSKGYSAQGGAAAVIGGGRATTSRVLLRVDDGRDMENIPPFLSADCLCSKKSEA